MSTYAEAPRVPVSTKDVEALETLVEVHEDLLANDVSQVRGESVEIGMLMASGLAARIKREVGEPAEEAEIGAIEMLLPELVILDQARNLIRPARTDLAA